MRAPDFWKQAQNLPYSINLNALLRSPTPFFPQKSPQRRGPSMVPKYRLKIVAPQVQRHQFPETAISDSRSISILMHIYIYVYIIIYIYDYIYIINKYIHIYIYNLSPLQRSPLRGS